MSEYPLDRILGIMKPGSFNMSNPRHREEYHRLLRSEDYVAEEKYDGCRYVLLHNRLFSSRISSTTGVPVEKTENFPHIAKAFEWLEQSGLILDGEIYIPGKRSQDVTRYTGCKPQLAQERQEDEGWLSYVVFDILRVPGGRWLIDRPWYERRALLEELFASEALANSNIKLSTVVGGDKKKQFLDNLLDKGREGVVLKHQKGLYIPDGRPMWNWMKVKASETDDAVIIGFEPPTKEYTGKQVNGNWPYWEGDTPVTKYFALGWIGAIVLGKYKNGELVRVGTCSGFDESIRKEFSENPDDYIGKVVKVKMMERTNEGAYRHPAFMGIHPDKNPEECKL